jgi:hypothetical protein
MIIRQFHYADLPHVLQIEKEVWGATAASKVQIESRAATCPEGSIVAQHLNGDIVGYAAAQRIDSVSSRSWCDVTDNGTISNSHKPDGQIAFGVGMSVLPKAARFGVSGMIIKKYAETFVVNEGCHLMMLGSRLPGYFRWKQQHNQSIEHYLDKSRNGYSIDPELCLYERAGFQLLWPVANYFPDPASLNWGAMIAMNRKTALKFS